MKSINILRRAAEPAFVPLTWLALLLAYHGIYGGYFPTPRGTIGHDFGACLPASVDGFIWFAKNGPWEVPWFTPGFCGGQPFFADPQSGYYSVPQWLSFVLDPLTAQYLTLLLFASLGYFGTYLLARRAFALAQAWAILAAALYLFNSFLPLRTLIGETGYHGITLAPWLALALLTPAANWFTHLGLALLAGGIAAYWLQSGLTTLMVPAALSVALVLLVYRLYRPWPTALAARVLVAVTVSLGLSASKLVASLAFYSRFERTQYLLPGFADPLDLLQTNLLALFGSSEGAFRLALPALLNTQWAVFPHEWAYSFTPVPLVLILAGILIGRWRKPPQLAQVPAVPPVPPVPPMPQPQVTPVPQAPQVPPVPPVPPFVGVSSKPLGLGRGGLTLLWLAIALLCLLPLALQYYTPAYNAWLKGLPLIGATHWPMRWLILYLPLVPIASVLLTRAALGQRQSWAPWLAAVSVPLLVGINLLETRTYYLDQPYDPRALLAGYARLAGGEVDQHQVKAVGLMFDPATGAVILDERRNDLVVEGISQLRCYNPSFGYRLEKLPPNKLVSGPVLAERDSGLNILNPACYVFPAENHCQPGDRFRVDQRAQARAFVSYQPFPFNKSAGQELADRLTQGSLILMVLYLGLIWPWLARRQSQRGFSRIGPRSLVGWPWLARRQPQRESQC